MNKILNTVALIIAEQLNYSSVESITPESSIVELGADSLDAVEIVMAIEDDFKIEIPDEDWERVVTVQDAADLVARISSEAADER